MPPRLGNTPNNRLRTVTVIVGVYAGYAQRIVDGIIDYAERERLWEFDFIRELADFPMAGLSPNTCGVIAELRTDRHIAQATGWGVPVVAISSIELPGIVTVVADNPGVGQLAVRYFVDLGFRNLAFYGPNHQLYASQRRQAFLRAAGEVGGQAFSFDHETTPDLRQWLLDLPKPVGILGAEDIAAVQVANACREVNLAVPEQVAVLGVDNDERLCRMATPPLSSIDHGTEQIGFRAAETLDMMMRGETPASSLIRIPPQRVVVRQSTDTLAIEDPFVAQALRFIRERACDGISVDDVVDQQTCSRRTLENNFKRTLGRTIHEEITRVRLDYTKHLLAHTDLAMSDICVRTGFNYASRLSRIIKQETGLTPLQYRRTHRQ